MASLGATLLLIAFVVAAYTVAAAVVGGRRRNSRLVESAIGAFYTVAALMTVASGVIIYAFVAGDYSIRYVRRYSDSVQPLFYKITSYWGGLDGSVMFWVFLLSVFAEIFTTTGGGPGDASTNVAFLIFKQALLNFDAGVASAGALFAVVLANIVAAFLIRMIGKNLD